MSKRSLVPVLKQHSNGSAYCKWRGNFYYFGPWRTPDMDGWRAFLASVDGANSKDASQPAPSHPAQRGSVPVLAFVKKGHHTINDLIAAFIASKEEKYRESEYRDNLKKYRGRWKQAFTPLLAKYGNCLVKDFGPKAFKDVRRAYAKDDRSRTYINDLACEVKLAFAWGVEEEIVPVEIHQALAMVKILRPGELPSMPEGKEVQPVPMKTVRATLPLLAPPVAAIVELMTLTVSRPGEIASIEAKMIDKNGPNKSWVFHPQRHKTAWKGKVRFLVFKGRAIDILKEWWKANGPFFVNARTGKAYTSEQLRCAIAHACRRAGIPYWFPYQIRHEKYSQTSREHGSDAAALLAGHVGKKMAERYDHSKIEQASRFAG